MTKLTKILGLILLLLFTICIVNILYNWDYFCQYSGVKTPEYYLAYRIWYMTEYGILLMTVILICAVVSNIYESQQNKI